MNRRAEIELNNMCLIYDEDRILVEEKKGTILQAVWFFQVDMLNREKV